METARALFNFARDQRHLPAYAPNPFTSLAIERMPVEDAKPIRPMSPDQEQAFFKACDAWQFRVFFLFAFTGLRVGELCHLLIDHDVDLDNNIIRITNKPRLSWQVKTGDVVQGERVAAIGTDTVTMERDGQKVELQLENK